MPIGGNCDLEHRYLRLPTGIAGVRTAIPRLHRLQDLFYLDLRLTSAQPGWDQAKPQTRKAINNVKYLFMVLLYFLPTLAAG